MLFLLEPPRLPHSRGCFRPLRAPSARNEVRDARAPRGRGPTYARLCQVLGVPRPSSSAHAPPDTHRWAPPRNIGGLRGGNLAQASICGTRAAEGSRISHSISGRRCSKGTRGPGPVADFRVFLKNPRVLRAFADEVRDGTGAKGVFFSVARGAQPILRLEGRVK